MTINLHTPEGIYNVMFNLDARERTPGLLGHQGNLRYQGYMMDTWEPPDPLGQQGKVAHLGY